MYALIGVIIATAILGDDTSDGFDLMIILWPAVIFFGLVFGLIEICRRIGMKIHNKFIKKEKKDEKKNIN